MTDVIGIIKLILFIVRHPIGTYKFVKGMSVFRRSLALDVFGNVTPLHRRRSLTLEVGK